VLLQRNNAGPGFPSSLTDGQGCVLSGHRTQRAHEGYANRTLERALPAARKRYAHWLANVGERIFRMPSAPMM